MSEWGEYISVAERRADAKREMDKLRKKGKSIEPIEIQGRTIAKKFWGKKWCEHLEAFSDYSNRLPRGRTYTRNGSICHLRIKKGCVEAIVSGSCLYNVKVNISTLKDNKWEAIKKKSRGQIGTLLELLKGKLSDHIMEVVADHKEGLFPNKGEIKFTCDCPDWASMCKHVAAVLYGIGSRLDSQPDLLFLLRGVDASELITTELSTVATETDDLLDDEGLSDIFGIDLDDAEEQETPVSANSTQIQEPITGTQLQKIRMKMDLSVVQFAEKLQVTPASIYRWEKKKGVLNLHDRSANAITAVLKK
jgi:uncharacterized Zn finger protein